MVLRKVHYLKKMQIKNLMNGLKNLKRELKVSFQNLKKMLQKKGKRLLN